MTTQVKPAQPAQITEDFGMDINGNLRYERNSVVGTTLVKAVVFRAKTADDLNTLATFSVFSPAQMVWTELHRYSAPQMNDLMPAVDVSESSIKPLRVNMESIAKIGTQEAFVVLSMSGMDV